MNKYLALLELAHRQNQVASLNKGAEAVGYSVKGNVYQRAADYLFGEIQRISQLPDDADVTMDFKKACVKYNEIILYGAKEADL